MTRQSSSVYAFSHAALMGRAATTFVDVVLHISRQRSVLKADLQSGASKGPVLIDNTLCLVCLPPSMCDSFLPPKEAVLHMSTTESMIPDPLKKRASLETIWRGVSRVGLRQMSLGSRSISSGNAI